MTAGRADARIMVVDDDPFGREMLSSLLAAAGYEVLTAVDGRDALEQCRAGREIQLIVSDVNMPRLDGLQLIQALRQEGLEVPIVMVTSVATISVAVEALGSGAIDYLLKDEGIADTIEITVKRALEKHQLTVQNRRLLAELAAKTREQEDTLAYLDAIIGNIPDGLLVTNAQGRITLVNPALGQMFGEAAGAVTGRDCREVFAANLAPMLDLISTTEKSEVPAQVELAGGRVGSAIGTAVYRRIGGGADEFAGYLIVVRDVTHQKEIERMKDDFVATVSHELRTPLTSVLGFARLIEKKLNDLIFPRVTLDDPKVARAVRQIGDNVGIIISESRRLTNMINNVLDLSKMEAGKIDWRREEVEVADLIKQALAATTALFAEKGLELVREIGPDLPPLYCDRDRMLQVLINLLSNALKFTDQGGITVRAELVRPAAQDRPEAVAIAVIDTGCGIAKNDLATVFEKFRQVGYTLSGRPRGTGLGLPICKQIVEHHGGVLSVQSEPERGSTFRFVLPAAGTGELESNQRGT